MATDNPFLQGMLGGLQLATATRGAEIQAQTQMLDSMMRMQAAQIAEARQMRLFEQQQANLVLANKRDEMEHRWKMEERAAELRLAHIEAPVKRAELGTRLVVAETAMANALLDQQKLRTAAEADSFLQAMKTEAFGTDAVGYRAKASAFFASAFAQLDKMEPGPERSFQERALTAARSKYEAEETSQFEAFSASVDKILGSIEDWELSGDKPADEARRALKAEQIERLGAKYGMDTRKFTDPLRGVVVPPPDISKITNPDGAVDPDSLIPTQVPVPGSYRQRAVELATPVAFQQADSNLYAAFKRTQDPDAKERIAGARVRLEAVRRATTTANDQRVYGGIRARGLSAREVQEMLGRSTDPDSLLGFLDGMTEAAPAYVPMSLPASYRPGP